MQVNIEELRDKLLQQAKEEADRIIKDAERRAEEIIAKAEKEWARKSLKEKERVIREAETKARIIISEAKRRARILVSQAKSEVIESVFSEAWKEISSRNDFSVEESLRNLLNECLEYIPSPRKVYVAGQDRDLASKILMEKNLGAEVAEASITGGIIAEDAAGNKIDNSYDTRFYRSKQVLQPIIAKVLWGSG